MPNDLDNKIRHFEKKLEAENRPVSSGGMMAGAGRAGYEIIICLIFFTTIGGLLDWQLGTLPWITLALFFMGFVTGLYNAWRALNAKGDRVGLTQSANKSAGNKG